MTTDEKGRFFIKNKVHEEEKQLFRYREEKGKEYYNMGIPARWRDINHVEGEKVSGRLFYSQISRGYFLWASLGVLKRRLELEERTLDMQKDVKRLIGEEASEIMSPAALDLLRMELFASLTHGYETIKLTCKSDKEIAAAVAILGGIKDESQGIIGKPILSTSKDPRTMSYTIGVEKEKETGTETFAYDFHSFTKEILDRTKEFFLYAERCIKANIDETFRSIATTYERVLDFLWAYGSRQLVKGINRGVFCGNEFSGVHAIGLGGFYKLLEHTIDDLIRVLQVLHLFKLEFHEDGLRDIDDFARQLATDLGLIRDEIEKIDDVLLNSMVKSLSDEDYAKIGEMIKNYNTVWKKKFGATAEGYLESVKHTVKEYEEDYFGKYGHLVQSGEPYKKYQFLLSQLLLPLQRIARFPRIIAIFARFMASARTEKR